MSVLQGLKGTFKGVQQDIVEGLKALTSFEGHPKTETLKRLCGDGINLDAGADLLKRYQKYWEEIDQNNKENAKQAKVVDDKVNTIFKSWEKQAEVMMKLEDSVKHVPDLLQVLTQLTLTLNEVKEDFKKVEAALDELEDVRDEEELQKQMMSHTLQLQQYQQTRYSDIEKVKVTLAKEHAQRVQEIEKNRNEKLQERQNAFEEAFSNDVSFYKQYGNTGTLKLPEISKVASLSEITIEQDHAALDDFLASQTTTPLTDTGPDVSVEEMKGDGHKDEVKDEEEEVAEDAEDAIIEEEEEGTFIEDDYTEDFSNSETSQLQDELNDLHAKLENNDISYKSTFDTDSVEKDDAKDKKTHVTTKNITTESDEVINKDQTTELTSKSDDIINKERATELTSETDDVTNRTTLSTSNTEVIQEDRESISPNSNNVQEKNSVTEKDSTLLRKNDDNNVEVTQLCDTKISDSETGDSRIGDSETNDVKTGDANIGNSDRGDSKIGNSETGHSEIGDSETSDAKIGNSETSGAKIGDSETDNA